MLEYYKENPATQTKTFAEDEDRSKFERAVREHAATAGIACGRPWIANTSAFIIQSWRTLFRRCHCYKLHEVQFLQPALSVTKEEDTSSSLGLRASSNSRVILKEYHSGIIQLGFDSSVLGDNFQHVL